MSVHPQRGSVHPALAAHLEERSRDLQNRVLSTFVLVSQNRSDAVRQVVAEHQYKTIETEGRQTEDLLRLSRQILALTEEVHRLTVERRAP
jgi:hypothetical protein